MGLADQDPSIVQDFLTESGELIDQLDTDLLGLESSDDAGETLNSIFRGLHTIKGASSFLALSGITSFAHAAEFALDRMRKGEVAVSEDVVDCLLRSVDVLKAQLGEVASGVDPGEAPSDLMLELEVIANGEASVPADAGSTGSDPGVGEVGAGAPLGASVSAIDIAADKADVLPYMAEDLRESAVGLRGIAGEIVDEGKRTEACGALVELASSIDATATFFDLADVQRLTRALSDVGSHLAEAPADAAVQVAVRLDAVALLLGHVADGLVERTLYSWETERLAVVLEALAAGHLDDGVATEHGGDAVKVLELDGVIESASPGATCVEGDEVDGGAGAVVEPGDAAPAARAAAKRAEPAAAEATIRVEVSRLEALLNLVGEMTLTKNQVLGVARDLSRMDVEAEFSERVAEISFDLDRLTSELQSGVMRTRMQPLDKLFGRYPRIVRDLAKATGKNVNLVIEGGDTEVDKSVLELLGDPLIHMLRNSVDHGIETPEQRAETTKASAGTLLLRAEHQGGHVRILVEDDGRGIDREVIGRKAVEKGLASAEAVANMPDSEVFKFIFAAGFSTAANVSDLSGRGVGMDVVNQNIRALNGVVHVQSELGGGTQIEIMIPLTVATMPAMVVEVSDSEYAIPISAIEEITRILPGSEETVNGRAVLRVRDRVIGLLDMRRHLSGAGAGNDRVIGGGVGGGFVVVVGVGQEKAGLIVDRLIGQQEVVIKALDDDYTSCGPFSGATIREDGTVNLIFDVVKLLRSASTTDSRA